ncbi:MAG: ABC transporter permease [Candidatus Thorarchaeota archaeon]|nr:ABC transporter permease [Candidatus Thorarchaeota archaeon]
MEQEKKTIFQKMWNREGARAELRAANALALKQWQVEFSYPLSVLWFIVMPFLWFIPLIIAGMAITGGAESAALEGLVGTSDWITYIALGSAYTGLAISLMWGTGQALRREQNVGTLETLMTTPMKKETLVWGSMLHNLQHGGLGVILQLTASILLFGVTLNWWGIIPALMIVCLSVIGMQGLIFTVVCVVLVAKQGWMIVELISSTLLLIAPISYPIAVLPTVLQYFSYASPLTWSVEGFRGFLMDGVAYSGAFNAIVALIILDVIFVIVGGLLFKRTERYVRMKGALSQF